MNESMMGGEGRVSQNLSFFLFLEVKMFLFFFYFDFVWIVLDSVIIGKGMWRVREGIIMS